MCIYFLEKSLFSNFCLESVYCFLIGKCLKYLHWSWRTNVLTHLSIINISLGSSASFILCFSTVYIHPCIISLLQNCCQCGIVEACFIQHGKCICIRTPWGGSSGCISLGWPITLCVPGRLEVVTLNVWILLPLPTSAEIIGIIPGLFIQGWTLNPELSVC